MKTSKTEQQFNQEMEKKFETFRLKRGALNKPSEIDALYEYGKNSFIKYNLLPQEQQELQDYILSQTEANLSCAINDNDLYFSQYLRLINLYDPFCRYIDSLIEAFLKTQTPTSQSEYKN